MRARGRSCDDHVETNALEGPQLIRWDAAISDEHVNLLEGPFPRSLAEAPLERAALLRVGADVAVDEALTTLYDRVTLGGFVVVDGCSDSERRAAVNRFRAEHGMGAAVDVSDHFLEKRQLIVYHYGRHSTEQRYYARNGDRGEDYPIRDADVTDSFALHLLHVGHGRRRRALMQQRLPLTVALGPDG